MESWNNTMYEKFGNKITSPNNLEGKKVSSENYAGLENLRAMGDHWLVDVISYSKAEERVIIFTAKVGTRADDVSKLYAYDIEKREVK